MGRLVITSLTLAQFRSHAALQLGLDGRPLAIFGANGAGKTNILEAVSLLSPGRGLRRAAPDEIARKRAGVGWKVSAIIDSLGHIHEVETAGQTDAGRTVRIDDKSATQAALGRVSRILWLVPAMDRLWIEGADGRRRFMDRMTLSFEPSHAEASLAYEKAMRERNRMLRDQVADSGWYAAVEAQMADAGARIIANRAETLARVQSAQDVAGDAFPAAELTIVGPDNAPDPETADDLAAALAESRPRDLAAGRTLVGPHRADLAAAFPAKGLEARSCSTGEQKALLISLVLANARALAEQTGAPPILLLDEVAAHLDGDRRAVLYDEIRRLGAQAWMTATGPEYFAGTEGEFHWIAVSEEDGDSIIAEGGKT